MGVNLLRDGVGRLFTGYLISLFLGIAYVLVVLIEASILGSIYEQSLSLSESFVAFWLMITMAVLALVSVPVEYFLFYMGFSKLAMVNPSRYGIGRLGALLSVVVDFIEAVSFTILSIASPSLGIFIIVLVIFGIVGLIIFVLIAVALYRLAEEYSSTKLSVGIILLFFMYLFNIVFVSGFVLGIIGLIGYILLLAGIDEVRNRISNRVSSNEQSSS